jgi:predicted aspartyl protease
MPTVNCGFTNGEELGLYGPTLAVEIGFDSNFQAGTGNRPVLQSGPLPALVDTGAVESCIDSALAEVLQLPIVDRLQISGVGGAAEVNVHLAQIYIPELQHVIHGPFSAVHLTAGGQPHYALIGRTFLHNYTMIYDGRTGAVTLSND